MANAYEADLLEHAEVLGNLRLRPAQRLHEVSHRLRTPGQSLNYLPSLRLGYGVEDIQSRERPWHSGDYIPIMEYVN